ncbi:MAG TPA: hypothetical protein PKJ13_13865 [bacterium]|nr:hypothetical protein [bacterium]
MLALKLAIRNLLGAGLRTWLTAGVLSIAFVVMVFYQGLLDGWNLHARTTTREWEIGGGQYWHPAYDRFDPFSLQEAHAPLSHQALELAAAGRIVPELITQATAYPDGRMVNLLIRGIPPGAAAPQPPHRRTGGRLGGDTSPHRPAYGGLPEAAAGRRPAAALARPQRGL